MTVAERLRDLGIHLPPLPQAMAIYRPALRTGNYVYVSGQVAVQAGSIVHPGRLGEDVSIEEGIEAARVCAVNVLAAANAVLGSLDGARVIRMVGFVASDPSFTQQPQVVDGASELLRDVLGEERGVGTRLALGVVSLPANSPVELELQLEID